MTMAVHCPRSVTDSVQSVRYGTVSIRVDYQLIVLPPGYVVAYLKVGCDFPQALLGLLGARFILALARQFHFYAPDV